MSITTVLFDVGNTLIHPEPSVAETFTHVALSRGYPLALSQVLPHIPAMEAIYEEEYAKDGDFWCSHEGSVKVWMDQYRFLCHCLGLADDAEFLAKSTHNAFCRAENWTTFPEVLETLYGLKERGITLAIVSNWDAGLEGLLRDLSLLPFFDTVLSSAVVGYRKPNPVIFQLACEALGVRPEECIHVGDSIEADGAGAIGANVTPIIINRNTHLNSSSYRCITSLRELIGIIEAQ